jgi:hypothetical protein
MPKRINERPHRQHLLYWIFLAVLVVWLPANLWLHPSETSEQLWERSGAALEIFLSLNFVSLPVFGVVKLSSAGLKAIANRPTRAERWRAAGCCEGCGYDMRASPERCPECGLTRDPTADEASEAMARNLSSMGH